MATPPSRSPSGYPGIRTNVIISQGWYEQQPPFDGASAGGEVLSARWFEGETRPARGLPTMTACRGTANWLGVHYAYTLDLSGRDLSAANAAVRGADASPSYLPL
jgi:hypothetical protein